MRRLRVQLTADDIRAGVVAEFQACLFVREASSEADATAFDAMSAANRGHWQNALKLVDRAVELDGAESRWSKFQTAIQLAIQLLDEHNPV